MPEPLSSKELLDLYRIALDEYRFEVRLGWDRTTYFLVLNSAILTVATGLLKLQNPPVVFLFIAILFSLGLGTSLVGAASITRSHEYYRRTIVKKTVIESRLGLTEPMEGMHPSLSLAIGTTKGQGDHLQILDNPEAYVSRKLSGRAITFQLRLIFRVLAAVHIVGMLIALVMMVYALGGNHSIQSFMRARF